MFYWIFRHAPCRQGCFVFFPRVNQWDHNLQEHEWKYSAAFNSHTLFLTEKDKSFHGLHCLLLDQKQAYSCWKHPCQTLQCIYSEFTVSEQAGDTVTHWLYWVSGFGKCCGDGLLVRYTKTIEHTTLMEEGSQPRIEPVHVRCGIGSG